MSTSIRKKQPLTGMRANECDTSRLVGSVEKYHADKGYGFIKPDNDKSSSGIFFSRRNLITRGQLPKVRDRVEFCVRKDIEGRPKAIDILVQVIVYIKLSFLHYITLH
jgi:cold shock CspA family protein